MTAERFPADRRNLADSLTLQAKLNLNVKLKYFISHFI